MLHPYRFHSNLYDLRHRTTIIKYAINIDKKQGNYGASLSEK